MSFLLYIFVVLFCLFMVCLPITIGYLHEAAKEIILSFERPNDRSLDGWFSGPFLGLVYGFGILTMVFLGFLLDLLIPRSWQEDNKAILALLVTLLSFFIGFCITKKLTKGFIRRIKPDVKFSPKTIGIKIQN